MGRISPVPPFWSTVGRIFLRRFHDTFSYEFKNLSTVRKGPHMSQFCTTAQQCRYYQGASRTCLCCKGLSSCRRCIVVTLMSPIFVPTANQPRQGRFPFRVRQPMHFSRPPHLRAQAVVLHPGLVLRLQVVHEANEALATRRVGCERHGNGHWHLVAPNGECTVTGTVR